MMKRALILIICHCMVVGLAWGQSEQQKQRKVPGFRDIPWGANLDSVYKNGEKVEFQQVKGENQPQVPNVFVIPSDDNKIGTVELNKIHYFFSDDNRFYKVRLTGEKEDLEDMNFILRHKFGEPMQVEKSRSSRTLEWTIDNVDFTLTNTFDSPYFVLVIASNWEEIKAYRLNTSVDDF